MSKLKIKSMLHNEADILEAEDVELQEVITPAVDNIVEPKLENKINTFYVESFEGATLKDKLKEAVRSCKRGDIFYTGNETGIVNLTSENQTYKYVTVLVFPSDIEDVDLDLFIQFKYSVTKSNGNVVLTSSVRLPKLSYDENEEAFYSSNTSSFVYPQGIIAGDRTSYLTFGTYIISVGEMFDEQHGGSYDGSIIIDTSVLGEFELGLLTDRSYVGGIEDADGNRVGIISFKLTFSADEWHISNVFAVLESGYTLQSSSDWLNISVDTNKVRIITAQEY